MTENTKIKTVQDRETHNNKERDKYKHIIKLPAKVEPPCTKEHGESARLRGGHYLEWIGENPVPTERGEGGWCRLDLRPEKLRRPSKDRNTRKVYKVFFDEDATCI